MARLVPKGPILVWFCRILSFLCHFPLACTGLRHYYEDALELGLRSDRYEYEFSGANNRTKQDNWTVGLNWRPAEPVRCQPNHAWKQTKAPFDPDLDDNILLANVQVAF